VWTSTTLWANSQCRSEESTILLMYLKVSDSFRSTRRIRYDGQDLTVSTEVVARDIKLKNDTMR
jgi:hypothetical protein